MAQRLFGDAVERRQWLALLLGGAGLALLASALSPGPPQRALQASAFAMVCAAALLIPNRGTGTAALPA